MMNGNTFRMDNITIKVAFYCGRKATTQQPKEISLGSLNYLGDGSGGRNEDGDGGEGG